jgi:cold shock CspA family protein
MFDADMTAHIKSLEQPAPKRTPEKQKAAGKYCGAIRRWSRYGYGFIKPDQTIPEIGPDAELFVGAVQLRRSRILHPLQHGDRLSFDLKKAGDGRYEACNVSLLAA